MQEPRIGEGREQLKTAVSRIKASNQNDFRLLMDWIRKERDERDRENRIKSEENATTEAQALTTIIEFVESEDE